MQVSKNYVYLYYNQKLSNIMKAVQLYLLIALIIQSSLAQEQLYRLQLVSKQRGAACLDGSAPGYYLHEGSGNNKNKYLLVFQGGGFCGESTLSDTLESCYQRSFTKLGSTSNAATYVDWNGRGIVSTSQKQNRLFYDWNKVIVLYCDGSQFIGHRDNPINYKEKDLYFRGSKNVKQIFYDLDKKLGFYDGDTIIISGLSAGGMATYEWTNYLAQNTRTAKILTLPDSGFFITDYQSPILGRKVLRERVAPLLNLVYNKTQMPQPIQKCLQKVGFDIVDCVNAGNYAQYLKAPIFMVQSPYDAWSVRYIIGAGCLTNPSQPYSIGSCNSIARQAIQDYRKKSLEYFGDIRNNRKDVGIWSPACVQHGFEDFPQSYNGFKFRVNGLTLMEAIQRFLNNPYNAEWLLDEFAWPGNMGCSGLNSNNLRITRESLK